MTATARVANPTLLSQEHSIEERIRHLVADKLKIDPTQIQGHTRFSDWQGDSLTLLETFFEIESTFEISLPEDIESIASDFDSIVAIVKDKLRHKAAPTYFW